MATLPIFSDMNTSMCYPHSRRGVLRLLCVGVCAMAACQQPDSSMVLYDSDAFTVYSDKVVQGDNGAEILSPTQIRSNYQSTASKTFSRLVKFKYSINEKDNELPPGIEHWVIIGDEHETSVVTFGEDPAPMPEDPGTFLPVNYAYTFRVDMSPVLRQFEEQGYYETFDGTRVARDDFKGFYIAGGAEPLSWDFVNLDEMGLKLTPTEGDPDIYEIKVTLNPFDTHAPKENAWQLTMDLSDRPRYASDQPIVDALFNMSLEEAIRNIEPDSTFRTGAEWGGVWTRDISYSIFLAFAYHEPEVAKISLRRKVRRGRIIQDTGSGGAWPVSSDRTTWVLAAWEIYKATGEKAWLDEVYPIVKHTLDDDYQTLYDPETGMYSGESSFLDWREQTYPKWMSNMDIYVSKNLGTNVVHYQAHRILAEMARLKGDPAEIYDQRAEQIRNGINDYLWLEDRGYYAQYLYGRTFMNVSPRFEALGEALAVLFGVAPEQRARSVVSRAPLTAYGTTCIYPQIPGIPPYHNNGIWPFVQSYWNLAAARVGNGAALNHGLASIYRAGALFLTNYENFVAETGDYVGTEINSERMLWSMAGNLAMVHRVFMGMSFELDGLHLNPVVPEVYGGSRTLSNFKYREAVLSITVHGFGNKIQSISMDGEQMDSAVVPADITGAHAIVIQLDNATLPGTDVREVKNHFSLPTPLAGKEEGNLHWAPIEGAREYWIYLNGEVIERKQQPGYGMADGIYNEYKVSAIDEKGYESFTSEPVFLASSVGILEMERFATPSRLPYSNFSGDGFVEISTGLNREINGTVLADKAGTYLLDIRYSNGSGPWNTDNKCAIRSLYVNNEYQGVFVFPQRGQDEWSDWGYSNSRRVALKKGRNAIRIAFENWNNNMNVEVNKAMLDYVRIIALDIHSK